MDRDKILVLLATEHETQRPQTTNLRHQASTIITNSSTDVDYLPSTLLDLLTQIIKPLFTTTKHPHLTSTGRRNLLPAPPPSIANRFISIDDDEDKNPWKTHFTVSLLQYILHSYTLLPYDGQTGEVLRKTTIEAHVHLLVPPTLNMIDDAAPTPWKSSGCQLLKLLCGVLVSTRSEMLRRTGLADVFVDALKTNFSLLPTLTAEEDSVAVMQELYPAFLGVVDARFTGLEASVDTRNEGREKQNQRPRQNDAQPTRDEFSRYQDLLTLLFRHGILASLAHLSPSSESFSSTISVTLTTLLLRQITPVFRRMGIYCVKHLQHLLPMLRMGLMDPFALAAPEMVLAALDVLGCVLEVAEVRVREKWWGEVLRAVVGCWVNCVDEMGTGEKGRRGGRLDDVMHRLKEVGRRIGEVLGEEWEDVKTRLSRQEEDLTGFFA